MVYNLENRIQRVAAFELHLAHRLLCRAHEDRSTRSMDPRSHTPGDMFTEDRLLVRVMLLQLFSHPMSLQRVPRS